MTRPPQPVACTLAPADLTAQAGRWDKLIARSLAGRTETGDGLLLSFRPEAGAELPALVAVERGCCPWATWTLDSQPGMLVLTIRAAGEGVAALHALFGRDRACGPDESG
jgi:hypothetical protein